jgi:hypothetical protein
MSIRTVHPSEIAAPIDADWDSDWVSATMTRNHLLKDPLCDWLKYNYSRLLIKRPQYTRDVLKALSDSRPIQSFTSFIMGQGIKFEDKVIDLLYSKFGDDMIIRIGGELNARSNTKVLETVDAMNKGIPIIHSGVLHNPENRTYGIPDLLIRSDWLNNITSIKSLNRSEIRRSATLLTDPITQKPPKYHYVVVDVKFSTLHLRSDGIHLLNSGNSPAYKGQLYVYNEALSRIQGYNPKKAYLLGRRWKFSLRGSRYEGENCFDRLGTVDFSGVDFKFIDKTRNAIEWCREVRSEEAEEWKVGKEYFPFERKELYPNMCNRKDYPWRPLKEKIADEIAELTQIWMVGVKHRDIAMSQGIFSWKDERCDVTTLGIAGKKTMPIIEQILNINQPHLEDVYKYPVQPLKIRNNYFDWQNPKIIEFFVDFETISSAMTNFEKLPHNTATELIFMIGVGHINPCTEQWTYRSFTAQSLDDEERICQQFTDYILSESTLYNVDDVVCMHWSHAEESMWSRAQSRNPYAHFASLRGSKRGWTWLDLLKVFKEEPITIRGCLNFGLKSVTEALIKHKLISTSYNKQSSCCDGTGAMVAAWKMYTSNSSRNILDTPEKREIEEYNKVDVKVLYEIVTYLRQNHLEMNASKKRMNSDDSEEILYERRSKRMRKRPQRYINE